MLSPLSRRLRGEPQRPWHLHPTGETWAMPGSRCKAGESCPSGDVVASASGQPGAAKQGEATGPTCSKGAGPCSKGIFGPESWKLTGDAQTPADAVETGVLVHWSCSKGGSSCSTQGLPSDPGRTEAAALASGVRGFPFSCWKAAIGRLWQRSASTGEAGRTCSSQARGAVQEMVPSPGDPLCPAWAEEAAVP